MKSRRLTETDIANMAFLPSEIKRKRLLNFVKPKPISGSYEPFRSSAGDAVNQQFPFLCEKRSATPLDVLEQVVAKACKGDEKLLEMNLCIARATHLFATSLGVTAERADVRPISLAFGHSYHFSLPLIMRHGGEAHVIFPDLRRNNPLTSSGCRFIFSAMHQRWRENYPDLSALKLSIWRYANNENRDVRQISCTDNSLIPYEELLNDVRNTYTILHVILKEEEQIRRRMDNAAGPLFGT